MLESARKSPIFLIWVKFHLNKNLVTVQTGQQLEVFSNLHQLEAPWALLQGRNQQPLSDVFPSSRQEINENINSWGSYRGFPWDQAAPSTTRTALLLKTISPHNPCHQTKPNKVWICSPMGPAEAKLWLRQSWLSRVLINRANAAESSFKDTVGNCAAPRDKANSKPVFKEWM